MQSFFYHVETVYNLNNYMCDLLQETQQLIWNALLFMYNTPYIYVEAPLKGREGESGVFEYFLYQFIILGQITSVQFLQSHLAPPAFYEVYW